MEYLQLLAGDSHHGVIFGIEARPFHGDRQGDMIGAADAARQGDLFAFKAIERFGTAPALAASRKCDRRKTKLLATANR